MIAGNYFTENEDIQLHFENLLKRKQFIDEYEDGFVDAKKYKETNDQRFAYAPTSHEEAHEYYRTILSQIGDLCGNYFAQDAKELDKIGVKFEGGKVSFPAKFLENYKKFVDAGLLPYALTRQWEGLGLPISVVTLAVDIMARADIAFCMSFGVANLSEVIEKFGSEDQKKRWLPKMASGAYTGAMALSEPNFGSDLSSVMTRAVKQEDGSYRLTGTKRFITHGCGTGAAPAAVLTLARTGSPTSGARGLSFFIVDSKDIEVTGIEHKLGLKASPTCEVAYDNTPGEIIGEEGRGLTKFAMGMMNGARLGVANLSVGNATAAYTEAAKYAAEREQFGKKIKDIPAVKKILQRMEREVAALRCMNMEAAFSIDMYSWREERLAHKGMSDRDIRKDPQVAYWDKLASLFTPLAKYYSSEMANKLAYDAIQIHGGSGFVEDYDVARIYRDSRILSIYEGTTQLQVVACIGGVISGMAEKGQLRDYLDKLGKEVGESAQSKKIRAAFETALADYMAIENADQKAMVAFELVEICARYLNGLLLERTVGWLSGEKKTHRQKLAAAYQLESEGIVLAHGLAIAAGKAAA